MRRFAGWTLIVCLTAATATAATDAPKAGAAKTTAAAPTKADALELYNKIVGEYLQGDWEALDKDFRAPAREFGLMTPAQKQDIAYVHQVLAECRPPWWVQVKAGQAGPFRATVWDQPLTIVFDPKGKGGISISNKGGGAEITASWTPAGVENPAQAEHGFTVGDLVAVGIWQNMGMAATNAGVSPQEFQALCATAADKARFQAFINFRDFLTAVYYGTPGSRRWQVWLSLHAFGGEAGKDPNNAPIRAIGSWYLAEVLQNPSKYPSVKLPEKLSGDGAEELMAAYLKSKMVRDEWTLAEDKTLREATKQFAIANDKSVLQYLKVMLPNRLVFSFRKEEDAILLSKRDAWIKQQLDKAAKPGAAAKP
jgi:hypothetical protein